MKHSLQTSIVAALVAFCPFVGFAPQAKADIQTIRSSDSAVWGSVGGNLFDYKEPSPPPDLPDSERDWITSAAAGVNYLGNSDIYLALEGAYSFGNARYNGAYFYAPTTPLQSTTDEKIATVDGKIGKGFALNDSMMLIPYTELGFRYWNRGFGGDTGEDYQNFDALVGVMLQVSPAQSLILSAYGSGGTTIDPKMTTGGITYDLGTASMYKVGGKIGYDLTQRIELFTTLDYDHFTYGQSPVIAGAYEPNSRTNETALRVGLAYHFN